MNFVYWLETNGACTEARAFVGTHLTARAAWEACPSACWMMWLVGAVYRRGSVSRTRFTRLALVMIEPVMYLLPDDSVDDLGIVAQWTIGSATDNERSAAIERLYKRRRDSDADSYADAYAAAYAAADADAYAAVAADAVAYAAVAADAVASAAAVAAADADAALADAVRQQLTCEELCDAIGVSPDEPLRAEPA